MPVALERPRRTRRLPIGQACADAGSRGVALRSAPSQRVVRASAHFRPSVVFLARLLFHGSRESRYSTFIALAARTLFARLRLMTLVRFDDALHEWMTHDILRREEREGHIVDTLQDLDHVLEP